MAPPTLARHNPERCTCRVGAVFPARQFSGTAHLLIAADPGSVVSQALCQRLRQIDRAPIRCAGVAPAGGVVGEEPCVRSRTTRPGQPTVAVAPPRRAYNRLPGRRHRRWGTGLSRNGHGSGCLTDAWRACRPRVPRAYAGFWGCGGANSWARCGRTSISVQRPCCCPTLRGGVHASCLCLTPSRGGSGTIFSGGYPCDARGSSVALRVISPTGKDIS
jgi:hypothetical protein